eukprot:c15732_g1_i3 orf=135-614(+)
MPRRPANANLRRVGESGFTDSFISAVVPVKSRRSPLVSVCLVLLGVVILLCYAFFNSSLHQSSKKVAGTLSSDGHLDTILQGTVAEDAEDAGATQRMLEATGEGGKPFKLLKPRSRLWWQHRFQMMGLQESEDATKKFESLTTQKFLKFNYYVFHLDSL